MATMTVIDAVLHLLAESGVRHIFGNPGSMEFPLVDALTRNERIAYVLGLHEVPVLGMADGYAQASGGLGVANVHISPGLGNSMGMLYNAWRSGTPLLLTAGQQDRRLLFEEPVLWSDLARVAEPYTKYAVDVQRAEDVPRAIRRAIQHALTPPTGPVFVALPLDLQSEIGTFDLTPAIIADRRVRPSRTAVAAAANLLQQAERPAILAGCRTAEASAQAPLVVLAEQLGATVYSDPVPAHGRLAMPSDHGLYGGALPTFAPEIREVLERHDVVLAVGIDLITQYFHRGDLVWPPHVRLIHLDCNPVELGKNYAPDVAMIGDPQAGLAELVEAVGARLTQEHCDAAAERTQRAAEEQQARRTQFRANMQDERERRPMTALALMGAVAAAVPEEVVIVDEAVTSSLLAFERLGMVRDPQAYFGHRGWALGWGIGAALGVALALPQRPVVGLLGDGSLMYGIQGLWTAARYRLPVTYIVANNASYAILKAGMVSHKLPSALAGTFLGMDLVEPEIDFVALAQALGVKACRVEDADAVTEVVSNAVRSGEPSLIEVPIDRGIGLVGGRSGF